MNKAFVFVVCGSAEHLDTLRLSYNVLKNKTQYPVYVVTDHARNEYRLEMDGIVDVKTPGNFNHHQASVWLKTSLHKILPVGYIYVYLDTDILATGGHIDHLFDEYLSPIRFAPDHCKIPQFSPYAVNCNCLEIMEEKRLLVNKYIGEYDPISSTTDPVLVEKRHKLFNVFQKSKQNGRLSVTFYLRYFFSWPYFHINEEFRFDRRKKTWLDQQNTPLMHKVNMRKVAKKSGLRWIYRKNIIALEDGRDVFKNHCHHLIQYIDSKWQIKVADPNWQHWNGGVFLFSDDSKEFMDTWHNYTMEIFKDPNWKTRDQGTLIATVWKLGLQKHPTLDKKWNLILDYYNQQLEILDDGQITLDGKTKINPEFVHIYHHWGDTGWGIWNKILARCHKNVSH